MKLINNKNKIIFTFFMFCAIFFLSAFFLTGCFTTEKSDGTEAFYSLREDCPQCGGLKSVKSENGTLVTCKYCSGNGYIYLNPQGTYKQ